MAKYSDPRTLKPISDRIVGEAIETIGDNSGGVELPIQISDVKGLQNELDKKGTSNLVIGTTTGTAKDGAYTPVWNDVGNKPNTFAPIIGNTATTAAAGNHNHAVTAHEDSGLAAAANIQALAIALSTRIKALEDAAV